MVEDRDELAAGSPRSTTAEMWSLDGRVERFGLVYTMVLLVEGAWVACRAKKREKISSTRSKPKRIDEVPTKQIHVRISPPSRSFTCVAIEARLCSVAHQRSGTRSLPVRDRLPRLRSTSGTRPAILAPTALSARTDFRVNSGCSLGQHEQSTGSGRLPRDRVRLVPKSPRVGRIHLGDFPRTRCFLWAFPR